MPSSIQKLSPDRDLQCFYFQPSAIAAFSSASANGFTLSGSWRQQFDWAVVEWNRDNVYEHPSFRNLPDGDLSGLVLTYKETRTNCITLDSDLFATVDWPSLRVWATPTGGSETIYWVPLKLHATSVAGAYQNAFADFTLSGTLASGDYVGLATLTEHYTYQVLGVDTLTTTAAAIRDIINTFSTVLRATSSGATVRVYYTAGATLAASTTGVNGNRVGVYSYSTGAETWDAVERTLSGGASPTQWSVSLDFSSLQGTLTPDLNGTLHSIPTTNIRKLRWTYAADLQAAAFVRTEFQVVVSNWTVTGSNRVYSVASPGSQRIENNAPGVGYHDALVAASAPVLASGVAIADTTIHLSTPSTAQVSDLLKIDNELMIVTSVAGGGTVFTVTRAMNGSVAAAHAAGVSVYAVWSEVRGNYSGGTIHHSTMSGNFVTCGYTTLHSHTLYVGTRFTGNGATVAFTVDGIAAGTLNLLVSGEDALVRWPLGQYGVGNHTVTVTSTNVGDFYFDFVELAVPSSTLPTVAATSRATLATDWDTLHSISIAPERTAWFLQSLGFTGRANHYTGALWFYELVRTGHQYASATVTFTGNPQPNFSVTVTVAGTALTKLIHVGDTASRIAAVYALELGRGYTGFWAEAAGGVLTIHSRVMGTAGNSNTIAASTTSAGFTVTASGAAFTGGVDGDWRTDLTVSPRMNRAARDWSTAYYIALQNYGIDVAAAFSMELGNGDPSAAVGIAQVGPAGDPILLPTPSLQTNFSPVSLAYWQDVYLGMADLQVAAGLVPFLQFGEVQWWYFPNDGLGVTFSGMPFYDAQNQSQFQAQFGHTMATITTNTVDPATVPDEVAYLPKVIGNFTSAVISHVRATYPNCRFEVLYPTDVNQTAFNKLINYPASDWTPAKLTNLKTEAFGFTFGKNLDQSIQTILYGMASSGSSLAFSASQRSHLVGIGDSYAAWLKEAQYALGNGLESVVLFALDQFCLIGYGAPLNRLPRRVIRVGN